jgi:hypothetical protein
MADCSGSFRMKGKSRETLNIVVSIKSVLIKFLFVELLQPVCTPDSRADRSSGGETSYQTSENTMRGQYETHVGKSDAALLGSYDDRQRYLIGTRRVQLHSDRDDVGRTLLRNVATSLSLPRRHSHKFSPQKRSSFGSDKYHKSHPFNVPLVGSKQQQGTVLTLRDLPSCRTPLSINNTSHLLVVGYHLLS